MDRPAARFFLLIALTVAAASFSWRVGAAPLAPEQEQKVREVIFAQLAAFAIDDADRAFETATPAVREAIGSPGRFLAMVRGAYPMVYRPATVSFHKPDEDEGTVLQLVEIRDGNNDSWLALFALERQPDQSWRISGCLVTENRWLST